VCPESCRKLAQQVKALEAVIVHTYRIIAFYALKLTDPKEASEIWKTYALFCEEAIKTLRLAKDKFPQGTTVDVYDLALDYWEATQERYEENLKDSECRLNASLQTS